MLNNLNEVIEEKQKRVSRLHEELEICKILIQDKMNEVVQLQEEVMLLQEFVKERPLQSAGPSRIGKFHAMMQSHELETASV